MLASASGGRARSKKSFSTVMSSAAAPTASAPAAAARGQRLRHEQSPQAPRARSSGHFTHQSDAKTKTAVSGSQRKPSAHADAFVSNACSDSKRISKGT
jgi:hypothetical protein